MYEFYNANRLGNFVNDCTIRAISTAEDKTWSETYDELSRIAKRHGILLDDVNFIEPLLDYRYDRIRTYGETVGEFSENNPKGTYLVVMNGHITCIKNGIIIDTWDCRNRVVNIAWIVD